MKHDIYEKLRQEFEGRTSSIQTTDSVSQETENWSGKDEYRRAGNTNEVPIRNRNNEEEEETSA
jgi:hypothetical protein